MYHTVGVKLEIYKAGKLLFWKNREKSRRIKERDYPLHIEWTADDSDGDRDTCEVANNSTNLFFSVY